MGRKSRTWLSREKPNKREIAIKVKNRIIASFNSMCNNKMIKINKTSSFNPGGILARGLFIGS
ncbi:MAG: hypothetical protein J6K76_07190 [Spirochaetaceae bacterium]|nr:hypothetical protein [Spirochaetaceae bacterium]